MHRYYYLKLAAAYVRGKSDDSDSLKLKEKRADQWPRDHLSLFKKGLDKGLRLHRFKRNHSLPRVQKVLGILKSMQPANLLDIGTGRGVFLWPLLDQFPWLPVACIDRLDFRVADIQAVSKGGIGHLLAISMDAGNFAFQDKIFDGVTLLETLEHTCAPQQVIDEACRVAGRFIIVSVPSREDNNPEHIHLFTPEKLCALFNAAGDFKVKFDFVRNHIVALALRR